jgi:putative ABC transport system ATP-binding protein
MSPAITLNDLYFSWPRQTKSCIHIPHFSLTAGERIFIQGPSGSGKSTLLGLLGGVLKPQRGSINLLGQDLCALSSRKRNQFRADHIGFIFQQFNLLPWLSALDNVLLTSTFSPARKLRTVNAQLESERLLASLDLVPSLWHRPAAELSIGQQQRVAAARALFGRPAIIIADEPTSALDAARQDKFIELLLAEAHSAQSTILFVSHDERLTTHFDRVVALEEMNLSKEEMA